jgi:hypothetical protein
MSTDIEAPDAAAPPVARIPQLCAQAIQDLTEARSIGAVLSIKASAEALRVYAEKMRFAISARNACAEVVLLAEARIGQELEAARQRGELATHSPGRPPTKSIPGGNDLRPPATLRDLGITPKQAMNASHVAAAGTDAIRQERERADAEGRPLSRANVTGRRPAAAPPSPAPAPVAVAPQPQQPPAQAPVPAPATEDPDMPRKGKAPPPLPPPPRSLILAVAEDAGWGAKQTDEVLRWHDKVAAGETFSAESFAKEGGQDSDNQAQKTRLIYLSICAAHRQRIHHPPPEWLDLPAQRKLDEALAAAKSAYEAELEHVMGQRLQTVLASQHIAGLRAKIDRLMQRVETFGGIMPKAVYRQIKAGLHPDRSSGDAAREALEWVIANEKRLLSGKDVPEEPLHPGVAFGAAWDEYQVKLRRHLDGKAAAEVAAQRAKAEADAKAKAERAVRKAKSAAA